MIDLTEFIPDLKEMLPKPSHDEDIKFEGDRFVVRASISRDMLTRGVYGDHVEYVWHELYTKLVRHIASLMYGRDEYFAMRFIPHIINRNFAHPDIVDLTLGITLAVVPTREYVVPTYVFSEEVESKVVEFRCGYCNTPNPIEERHCSQCGAPRALLYQEVKSVPTGS